MENADLSILIPSRNEMFLQRTIDDIFEHAEGNTEVIAVLDGWWTELKQHPRLTVIHFPSSIGQRAATNQAARVASGKYFMKVDAHCSFDQGFDVKMMADMRDNWTMVPTMKNLHAFDWICEEGHRRYQGPSGPCHECGKPTHMDIVWHAKPSPNSVSYRFDRTLHFQYWKEFEKRPEGKGDITPTLGLQGSCFMVTRENYWELDICDEAHGSWGQQGVEVALKTWLSGGQVMVNKKTWYAHMFRTQGGDFGFPYPLSGEEVEKARTYSRDLWLGEQRWPAAVHDLDWLLEKFAPVPDWHDESKPTPDLVNVRKGVIYYTDNELDPEIEKKCQEQLLRMDLPIVSASIKPIHFGKNVHVPGERGALQMFRQILAALEASDAEIVFFCEADVLYHPSHFEFTPPRNDVFYYNTNVWKYDLANSSAWRVDDCRQVSGIACYRDLALAHYKKRVELVTNNGFSLKMGYEPGTHSRPERVDDSTSERWESEFPNVDIRHDRNLSPTKRSPAEFRNPKFAEGWVEAEEVPGWGRLGAIIKASHDQGMPG